MQAVEGGKRVLESVLKQLGFEATVSLEESNEGPCLQIHSQDSRYLIGQRGNRLDDIQYLVNRVVQKHIPDAPRIRVDCDNYRNEQEQRLVDSIMPLVLKARESGTSQWTKALNAYQRRVIHNALEHEGVSTHSEESNARFKKICIEPA